MELLRRIMLQYYRIMLHYSIEMTPILYNNASLLVKDEVSW